MFTPSNWLPVPDCTGVTVLALPDEDGQKVLLVRVAPGGEIPLHTHACASGMEIIAGRARVIGKDTPRFTEIGESIFKPAGQPHGFTDIGEEGFCFISRADGQGILKDEEWDFKIH